MPRTTRSLRLLAVLAVLVIAVAASCADESEQVGGATTTTEAGERSETTETTGSSLGEVPEGYVTIEGEGVSLAVPEGWEALDLSEEDYQRVIDEAAEANPQLGEALSAQAAQLASQGAVLFAIDASNAAFGDNVNVVLIPSGTPPLDELEPQIEAAVSSFGGEVKDRGRTELPAGEALRVQYTLDLTGADGSTIAAEGFQYYVVDGREGYVVTITLAPGSTADADQIAESFTIH